MFGLTFTHVQLYPQQMRGRIKVFSVSGEQTLSRTQSVSGPLGVWRRGDKLVHAGERPNTEPFTAPNPNGQTERETERKRGRKRDWIKNLRCFSSFYGIQ